MIYNNDKKLKYHRKNINNKINIAAILTGWKARLHPRDFTTGIYEKEKIIIVNVMKCAIRNLLMGFSKKDLRLSCVKDKENYDKKSNRSQSIEIERQK